MPEGILQNRDQILCLFHTISFGMHAFCILHEIRIRKIHIAVFSEMINLLPLNQSIAGICEDQCHNGGSLTQCRLVFLAVHHKAAVSGDRQHLFIRMNQLCCHGPRNRNSHSCKPVRDDTGVGFIAVVLTGNPHFVSTYIRDHNVILPHEFPDIIKNLLWLHRKRLVLSIALVLLHHFLLQFQNLFRLFLRLTAELNLLQGIGNISDNLNLRLIKHVDVCRPLINMNNLVTSSAIPFSGSKLNNIISYCNDQICHIQDFVLVILLRYADRPHGIFIIIRYDSFRHHGIYHRNFQFIRKAGQCFSRMIPHCTVSYQNDRMLCLINHGCSLINTAEGCVFLGADRFRDRFFRKSRRYCHLGHICRKINVACSGFFALRIFKGNPHDFIDRIRIHNLLAPLRNRSKQFHQIQILMGRQMHPLRSHLSGNCDQRRSVRVCIRGTGNQIGRTGS